MPEIFGMPPRRFWSTRSTRETGLDRGAPGFPSGPATRERSLCVARVSRSAAELGSALEIAAEHLPAAGRRERDVAIGPHEIERFSLEAGAAHWIAPGKPAQREIE